MQSTTQHIQLCSNVSQNKISKKYSHGGPFSFVSLCEFSISDAIFTNFNCIIMRYENFVGVPPHHFQASSLLQRRSTTYHPGCTIMTSTCQCKSDPTDWNTDWNTYPVIIEMFNITSNHQPSVCL